MRSMEIDIFFDLVCPWCFIGKHRLERALANHAQVRPTMRWRPFQLNPNMPPGGMDRQTYLTMKFGGVDRAAQAYSLIGDTAERDGLKLNLDDITRTPSTLDAHRLVQFAEAKRADAAAMVEAIFAGYFQDSRDIGDIDVLVDIAAAHWLDAEETRAFLKSGRERKAVRVADAAARRIGIQAVPCFVFDKRYAISGAQEPMAFYPLIDLAGSDDVASPIFHR